MPDAYPNIICPRTHMSGVFSAVSFAHQLHQLTDPPGLRQRSNESGFSGVNDKHVPEPHGCHNMPPTSGVDDHTP